MVIFLSELNKLKVFQTDIGNAFLRQGLHVTGTITFFRTFSFTFPGLLKNHQAVHEQHGNDSRSIFNIDDGILSPPLHLRTATAAIMSDYEVAECGTTFYVYRGGRAPTDVSHVRIHKSVFAIDDEAFLNCGQLEYVESHKELSKIGKRSFYGCRLLRGIDLSGVKIIEDSAFGFCVAITDADLSTVERIGNQTFSHCTSLTKISASSAESVDMGAFLSCGRLISAEFGERLLTIGNLAFLNCPSLRHIAIPLPLRRRDIFRGDPFGCPNLSTVKLVGKLHNSVEYITMAIWRNQMRNTINQINSDLPATHLNKTVAMRRWIEEVQDKIIHFKILHSMWLTRATTILELVLWKVKLEETEDDALQCKSKKAKINEGGSMGLSTNETRDYRYRQEKRIQCGADIIIKNVLSFLKLNRSDDTF
eukprot:scaffold8043_cov92-Skeletonema_dohrnii-CCMP3373.AAC.1